MQFWEISMKIGSMLGCHQLHYRCPTILGYQFFICYRCLGMYLGFILGIIAYIIYPFLNWYIILLVAPLIIDGVIQLRSSYESTHTKRIITGLCFGTSFIYTLVYIVDKFL